MTTMAAAFAHADVELRTGRSVGLPDPCFVGVNLDRVTLSFSSLDELQAWTTHLGAPIGQYADERGTWHTAQAELLNQPLRLSCFVRAEVAA